MMLLMLAAAIAAGGLAWLIIAQLERGVLDVCAVQQDAYVQLVLDQIELQQGRNDREIIDGILGTLDASSRKYWVFSKGETMLFVKDVVETNKYKGFNTASYYDSASAKAFLDSLQRNYVRHDSIQIDGKSYIASGATFLYSGDEYRLCLLTNRNMLLENNTYLRVKSELWVMVLALLVLLVAVPAILAHRSDILRRKTEQDAAAISGLQKELTALNDRFANRDWYDTQIGLWQQDTLPQFVQRLEKRRFSCVVLGRIHCKTEEAMHSFLRRAQLMIPKTALRFSCGEHDLILLFLNTEEHDAWNCIVPLMGDDISLDGRLAAAHTAEELRSAARQFTAKEQGA